MILELDNGYAAEVFDILCKVPFETATAHDTEPPTKRHPGIEQLIEQLDAELNVRADYAAEIAAAESDAQAQAEAEAQAAAEADARAMADAEADEYYEDCEGR